MAEIKKEEAMFHDAIKGFLGKREQGLVMGHFRAVLSANAGKVDAKPTAWVRFTSDGGYEGPIMDSSSRMDGVRRSVWTPLYAYIPSEQNIYQRYYATSNAWSDIPKDQYDYLLATYGENITLRIVYAAPSQQQAIDAGKV